MLGAIAQGLGIAASVFGGQSQAKQQKKFAQNQIQWRVMDAEKAGIHPIYALGASPIQYTPQAVGDVGSQLQQMGQDISRAKLASMDAAERRRAIADAAGDRALERYRQGVLWDQQVQMNDLDIATRAAQLARFRSPDVPPAPQRFAEGQHGGRFTPRPADPIASSVNDPSREAGIITDFGYARRSDGTIGLVQSQDMKQRTEDDILAQLDWHYRNTLLPGIGARTPPAPPTSEYPLPPGREWRWSWWRQAFEDRPQRRRRPRR